MFEVVETMENQRVLSVNEKRITLNREDPYGFWFFHWDNGEAPEVLRGAFTNPGSAYEYLENYLTIPKVKKK